MWIIVAASEAFRILSDLEASLRPQPRIPNPKPLLDISSGTNEAA